jgi:molybdopterin adenylyltransferase
MAAPEHLIRVLVVTVSDSAIAGTRADRSGPAVRERIAALGWSVVGCELVADETESIAGLLSAAADEGRADVIFTTGGTGVALRDVTPEATRAVIHREVPGVAELMRMEGRRYTPFAVLSRGVAGTRGRTLIVNLPGSPKGAVESLDTVAGLVPHIVELLNGRTEHLSVPRNAATADHVRQEGS